MRKELTDILKIETIKDELGIDTKDLSVDIKLRRYTKIADKYLNGAISENYPRNDERAIELVLLIIEDLYDRDSTNFRENNTIKKLKDDFILQLKLEGSDDIQSKNTNTEIS